MNQTLGKLLPIVLERTHKILILLYVESFRSRKKFNFIVGSQMCSLPYVLSK